MRFGYIPDDYDPNDIPFRAVHKVHKTEALPNSTSSLLSHSPTPANQLQIGCCTGASTTRAIKTRMSFLGYPFPFMPSALYLYAKTRMMTGVSLDEDDGARLRDVFKAANKFGICPEDSNPAWSWPFSCSDDRWKEEPPAACDEAAQKHKLVKYLRLGPDPNEIKSALANNMPVVIGVSWMELWDAPKVSETGVLNMPKSDFNSEGGHAIYLNGYGNYKDDYADGVNSWGDEWGDKGRFHISFKALSDSRVCYDRWAVDLMT